MRTKHHALVGLMAFLLLLGVSARTEAAFISYICNDALCSGGDDIIVADNAAGDLNPAAGAMTLVAIGAFAGWDVVVETSLSKPVLGSPEAPQLDITYTLANSINGADPIWLYASDTSFTGLVDLVLSLGGTSSINPFSIAGGAFGGSSNANLDLSSLVAFLTFTTGPVYGGTDSGGPVGLAVNPYSLTLGLNAGSVSGAGAITGNLSLTSIPEPVSALLMGLGLVCGGAIVRRRRRAV